MYTKVLKVIDYRAGRTLALSPPQRSFGPHEVSMYTWFHILSHIRENWNFDQPGADACQEGPEGPARRTPQEREGGQGRTGEETERRDTRGPVQRKGRDRAAGLREAAPRHTPRNTDNMTIVVRRYENE